MYSLSSHWNVASVWIWAVSVIGFGQYHLAEMIQCNFWKCIRIRCCLLCWFGTLLGIQLLCCANRQLYAETMGKRAQARRLPSPAELPAKGQRPRTVGQSCGWSPARASPVTFPSTATLASQMSSVNPDNSWTINSYGLEPLSFGISVFTQK